MLLKIFAILFRNNHIIGHLNGTAHDLMFQDLTGSVAVDNQTGLGDRFRTRFIDWFTTRQLLIEIRSGSVGTILKTFTIEYVTLLSTQFYDGEVILMFHKVV